MMAEEEAKREHIGEEVDALVTMLEALCGDTPEDKAIYAVAVSRLFHRYLMASEDTRALSMLATLKQTFPHPVDALEFVLVIAADIAANSVRLDVTNQAIGSAVAYFKEAFSRGVAKRRRDQ